MCNSQREKVKKFDPFSGKLEYWEFCKQFHRQYGICLEAEIYVFMTVSKLHLQMKTVLYG